MFVCLFIVYDDLKCEALNMIGLSPFRELSYELFLCGVFTTHELPDVLDD